MIIRIIGPSRSVGIEDPGNFRTFSVRIEGSTDSVLQANHAIRAHIEYKPWRSAGLTGC